MNPEEEMGSSFRLAILSFLQSSILLTCKVRPLHNAPFCPITASGSNFNPRNTQCIPVVEIIAFLVLGQNWTFFKGLKVCRGSITYIII